MRRRRLALTDNASAGAGIQGIQDSIDRQHCTANQPHNSIDQSILILNPTPIDPLHHPFTGDRGQGGRNHTHALLPEGGTYIHPPSSSMTEPSGSGNGAVPDNANAGATTCCSTQRKGLCGSQALGWP